MAKEAVPSKRGVQVNILLSEEEAKELDREIQRRQASSPGVRFSRTAIARDLVLLSLRSGSYKKKSAA